MKNEKPPRYAFNSTLKAPTKEMRKVNMERRARRESADEVYGSHHRFMGRRMCDLVLWEGEPRCGFYPDRKEVVGHHWHTVGAGGKDYRNQTPFCPVHHDHVHALGSISAACDYYRRDFRSGAVEYSDLYDREMGEVAEDE